MASSFKWILQLHRDVPRAARFYSEGLDFTVNVCTLRWAELQSGPLKLALMQSPKYLHYVFRLPCILYVCLFVYMTNHVYSARDFMLRILYCYSIDSLLPILIYYFLKGVESNSLAGLLIHIEHSPFLLLPLTEVDPQCNSEILVLCFCCWDCP